MQSFDRAEHDVLMAGLVVAVTWEAEFLADPSAAVWAHMFAPDRGELLLSPNDASIPARGAYSES